MEDLLQIAPEFSWTLENPTKNETIYCTSAIGLNSPVLFHHFIQFAIRSNARAVILSSDSTVEDISSICKRNGLNLETTVSNGHFHIVSVCNIEDEFINMGCIKSYNGTEVQSKNEPTKDEKEDIYIKATYSNCIQYIQNQLEAEANEDAESPIFVIVDDVCTFRSEKWSIDYTLRKLRSYIEDHFNHYCFVLCHPCGLDDDTELYHQLVHSTDIQFLLMPLSTGHSTNVHGSLIAHRDRMEDSIQSVTVRRHVKITDSCIKLVVPGSF